MLAPDELEAALQNLGGSPFEGVVYRAVFLEYLMGLGEGVKPQPLYALGAPFSGARFTPRGGMATLYVAEKSETAFAEAHQISRAFSKLAPAEQTPLKPTVLLTARAKFASILDLTTADVQETLGVTRAELGAKWRLRAARGQSVPTWELGRAIYGSGRFTGLRYESALRRGSFCLAVFPDRFAGDDFVSVFDPAGNIEEQLSPAIPPKP